ncbi:hypothetical protein LOD99_2059 [Oopsacas minuta]|uniref:Uncharacterized protein n=1 Tax=Oopsacas minuta TaxID=111878 RepID=A0AAV7K3C4_9METZ|nr:hypothetical protein LOD99_2059 [Oopsacas minuta]
MLRFFKDKLKKSSVYNPHPPAPIVFDTGVYNLGLALNKERNIFLVYGVGKRISCYCCIFTLEGELMTRVSLGFTIRLPISRNPPFANFTDERILLEMDGNIIREIFDSGVNVICFDAKIIGVNEDGNYYVILHHTSNFVICSPSGTQLFSMNPSLEKWRNERFFVADNTLFLLEICRRKQTHKISINIKRPKTQLNIHKYSLTTGEPLETATYLIPPRFNRCSIDQSNNVIIDFRMSNEYCVCYSDGRVADYKFEDEIKDGPITSEDFLITENLQLIRIFERECKIYNLL